MKTIANDERPGLDPRRLALLVRAAVERCQLDLSGLVVLTEAASGAYAVTPVLAALAGAKCVYALTRTTRYGTVDQIAARTLELAELVGASAPLEILTEKSRAVLGEADIVTNSGHVRPLDAQTVGWMKPTAVIPLMYESWELRSGDVDLEACRRRGIAVAGTNERHPNVDVFSFLGIMAIKQLLDAGVAVYGSRVLLACDNPFSRYIENGLRGAGAQLDLCSTLPEQPRPCDALLVAMHPRSEPVLGTEYAHTIARHCPGAVVVQYWGDLDRAALQRAGVPVWPPEPPQAGHMGILPSGVGPEPIVRLQAGGLKVGEVLARGLVQAGATDREFVQLLKER